MRKALVATPGLWRLLANDLRPRVLLDVQLVKVTIHVGLPAIKVLAAVKQNLVLCCLGPGPGLAACAGHNMVTERGERAIAPGRRRCAVFDHLDLPDLLVMQRDLCEQCLDIILPALGGPLLPPLPLRLVQLLPLVLVVRFLRHPSVTLLLKLLLLVPSLAHTLLRSPPGASPKKNLSVGGIAGAYDAIKSDPLCPRDVRSSPSSCPRSRLVRSPRSPRGGASPGLVLVKRVEFFHWKCRASWRWGAGNTVAPGSRGNSGPPCGIESGMPTLRSPLVSCGGTLHYNHGEPTARLPHAGSYRGQSSHR